MAAGAFSITLQDFTSEDRTWSDNYTTALSVQLAGTDIGTALTAGNTMLDSSYNLFGLIGVLMVCAGFGIACVYVGGDIWSSMAIATALAIIGARMGLVALGEVALIASLAWLFVAGKTWKVI